MRIQQVDWEKDEAAWRVWRAAVITKAGKHSDPITVGAEHGMAIKSQPVVWPCLNDRLDQRSTTLAPTPLSTPAETKWPGLANRGAWLPPRDTALEVSEIEAHWPAGGSTERG